MDKFLKVLLLTTLSIMGITSLWLYQRYQKNPEQVIPYPYIFEDQAYSTKFVDGPIVILGDRMAKNLMSYKKLLEKQISIGLDKNLKIVDLSEDHQGLHRSLALLKSLSNVPKIVIYHGASTEWDEVIFNGQEAQAIVKNFQLYENPKIATLVQLIPKLSRLIYHPIKYQKLTANPVLEKNKLNDHYLEFQKNLAIKLKLFEYQFDEFSKYILTNESHLLVISAPLNYQNNIGMVCPNSLDEQLVGQFLNLEKLFEIKDHKRAYSLSKSLLTQYPSNARLHKLHAEVALKLNYLPEARRHFEMSLAYDCAPRFGSPLFNNLLGETAKKYRLDFFDFNKLVNSQLGSNVLFENETVPQEIFYIKLTKELAKVIRAHLKIF